MRQSKHINGRRDPGRGKPFCPIRSLSLNSSSAFDQLSELVQALFCKTFRYHIYYELCCGHPFKTRSSWLNCALRDDEAVYWVSIGHYEAVAVGN